MIETHFWEQLAMIAQCGTLSAAAEKLYLTQPALSRSMKKLEELLGVELFTRGKNKITLNESGELAAKCAVRMLELESETVERIRIFDRMRRTITIGSSGPSALSDLVGLLSQLYPGMAVSSELMDEETLLRHVRDGAMQLAVVTHPEDDEDLFCMKYMEEALYLVVPENHELAGLSHLYLKDIDGYTILLHSNIGFWMDLCREHLSHSRFLLQNDFETFKELADASDFLFFTTSWQLEHTSHPKNKKYLPIIDGEANITYYIICRKKNVAQFGLLFPGQ